MNFEFSEEHEDLRRTVRQFLENESNETAVREMMAEENGFSREVWARLSEELGLAGLIIEEKHGGAGFGMVELAIVMEEMGRVLLCAPFLSSAVLATSAIELGADASIQADLLPQIASGEKTATLAFSEAGDPWNLGKIEMTAAANGDAFKLSGQKTFVLDGRSANIILVAAKVGSELTLLQVDEDAAGLTRESLPPLDPTRKLATLRFDHTPAKRIASVDVRGALEQSIQRTITALAAEQLGGAQRCLDMAVDYAKSRLQFGRPIGSYQAIKHQCADLLVEVELARSAAYAAAFSADDKGADIAAAMAKSFCSETYAKAAKRNIQIHGGMGFTWEHPAHLYLKRAKASEIIFGSPSLHREKVARSVGISAA